MERLRLVLACALFALVAIVPAIAGAAPVPPFETNGECLQCHDAATGSGALSKVDFVVPAYPGPGTDWDRTAPSVDMNKCNSCHWEAAGTHPFHYPGYMCGSCHIGWGQAVTTRQPAVSTPYGWFYSASSPSASPAELHAIHLTASWPAAIEGPSTSANGGATRKCVSCHAAAACDSCHLDPSPATHAPHGSTKVAPWTGVTSLGTPAGDESVLTGALRSVSCAAAECHNAAAFAPSVVTLENSNASIAYTGTWTTVSGTTYSGGSIAYSGTVGSTAAAQTEGAGQVVWIGTKGPAGGLIEVLVNGSVVATVDLYSPTALNKQTVWAGDVDSASSVAIRVTGQKNPSASNFRAFFDAFVISYPAAPFVPTCQSCHADSVIDAVDRTQTHGYETVDHQGDVGSQTFIGKACDACHSMDVLTEHERTSSASAGGGCGTCHPTPRDSFSGWDQSCQQADCHAVASPQDPHGGMADDHAVPAAGEVCVGCHPGGDLAGVHVEKASSADPAVTSCNLCHRQDDFPATADCTACHFTFEGHYDPVQHTSTNTLAGCDNAGCHTTRDLMAAHTEKNATFTCFGCHSSAREAVLIAIRDGKTDCGDCHDVGTGHYGVHAVDPPLLNADGTSNYPYGGSTTPSTDCGRMCHRGNLVDEHLGTGTTPARRDFFGASMTCASCHSSTNGLVVAAIVGDSTDCRSCHSTHGQVAAEHLSAFSGSPEDMCIECHSSDLTVEHNGDMTTTLPSGRVLSGCEICHDNYEGTRGTTVQTAIEITRDTKCTACHADYHGDVVHAASSASSQYCERCHPGGTIEQPAVPDAFDITDIHAGSTLGACKVCHRNPDPDRVPANATFECVECHATTGSDYHRTMVGRHAYAGMDPACRAAGCHVASTLPEEHARFAGTGNRYPAYQDSCALCHLNEDANRVDWSTAAADCSTCHAVHGDIDVIHAAPASQECVDCHETTELRDIHATAPGDRSTSCAVCHNGDVTIPATAACIGCHDYLPTDPKHYAIEDHSASVSGGCEGCHSVDMKTEHFKPSSGPVTCVECHEIRVDGFTTVWDRSCDACHPTKHASQNSKHVSTTTACSGSGCHVITDVGAIHSGAVQTPAGFTDGFESGTGGWATFSGWTRITSPRHSGSYAAGQSSTSVCTLLRNVATNAGADVQFSFWLYGNANTESTDWVKVEFKSTSGTWRTVWTKTLQDRAALWQQVSLTLPEASYGPFGPNTAVRITADVSDSSEYQRIDDVSLSQVVPSSPTIGCNYCHKSASEPATTTNCTSLGCHSAPNPHHGSITLKLTSSSAWAAACDDCHGRVHDRGSCDRCHNPSGLHGEASRHIDSNTACAGCHNVATADGSLNCLACHTDLDSGSDGGDGGDWGGGGWGW